MAVTARLRYLRVAPRKVRLVADLIRGKKVEEAQDLLRFTSKKAARPILKLLNSAVASATNTYQMQGPNLYISEILVNEGPKLKRWRARARGRAFEIQKKTSHIKIVLDEVEKKAETPKAKRIKKRGKLERKTKIQREKPKFKPELEIKKPETQRGIKRIFRRKSF